MRVVVALLLVIHGLIHLLGFLKAWKLADIPQLTGATLFPIPGPLHGVVGGLWLLTCLILVGAAPLILFRYGPWWIIAAIGVAVSQLLVIYAWPDAKAGTVLNIVLFIIVMFAWADARFQSDTDEQVLALFSKPSTTPSSFVNSEDLEKLPAPVRRWLEGSGVVGKQVIRTVRLKQRGQMRNSQGKGSMPATAHQYFRVDEPKFIWRVCVRMMHILPIAGRDSYSDGQGRMLIKVASLIPVVDADDEKIDQGALLRFLGEIVWFPTAALRPYIHW
ncbi:MAG: DUF6544 family protein, partial [candidate division Zixibacteria bacterium]|nr:DUF6544 family protein [candidate division Zixibacteria bacterium]